MFSKINRIYNAYPYVPVLTEIQGLTMITVGTICLGVSGILKVQEYYTGQKESLDILCDDADLWYRRVGTAALKQGIKQMLPVTGLALAVYVFSVKML